MKQSGHLNPCEETGTGCPVTSKYGRKPPNKHGGVDRQQQKELMTYVLRQTELNTHGDVLLWGNRVIIPPAGRQTLLNELHQTYPGIVKMKLLAKSVIWSPGMYSEIESCVQ